MGENQLPIKVEKRNLIEKVKKRGLKAIKIFTTGSITLMLGAGTVLAGAFVPALVLPMALGSAFSFQKLLNNTKYKSYKDLAFVVGKKNGNLKIYQDLTRIDMTNRMRDLSDREKAGFMQLQTLVGLTKFPSVDSNGNEITFETDTHSINQKTFKKLQELGYIKDYEEKFLKYSRLILPKLAFGNIEGLKKKSKAYNIKFKLTGKLLDMDSPELRRYFPMVFGEKNGIIAKKGYNFVRESDGSLTIDYKPEKPYIEKKNISKPQETRFKEKLAENAPTLDQQRKFIEQRREDTTRSKEEKEIDE